MRAGSLLLTGCLIAVLALLPVTAEPGPIGGAAEPPGLNVVVRHQGGKATGRHTPSYSRRSTARRLCIQQVSFPRMTPLGGGYCDVKSPRGHPAIPYMATAH
jgi:hypothetical protein